MSDENLNEMELSVQDANTLVDESKELLKSLYNAYDIGILIDGTPSSALIAPSLNSTIE